MNPRFVKGLSLIAAVALVSLVSANGAKAQIPDYRFYPTDATIDGSNYFLAYNYIVGYASGTIGAFQSPSSPTVNIQPGAFEFAGFADFSAYNASTVNIRTYMPPRVNAFDNSTINIIDGGQDGTIVFGAGNSITNVYNGTGLGILAQENSVVNSFGGVADLFGVNSSIVNLLGGEATTFSLSDNSIGNVRGGIFDAMDINASAVVNFYGNSLSAQLINPDSGGFSIYALSGTLKDGTLLTGNNFSVQNGSGASFNLISTAPEPGALVLFITGLLPIAGVVIRRRKVA